MPGQGQTGRRIEQRFERRGEIDGAAQNDRAVAGLEAGTATLQEEAGLPETPETPGFEIEKPAHLRGLSIGRCRHDGEKTQKQRAPHGGIRQEHGKITGRQRRRIAWEKIFDAFKPR